jgi:hypothetical protein
MSMVEYLRTLNPDATVTRPENIYVSEKRFHAVPDRNITEWVAITRDPVKRIQSGMKYFTELRNMTVEQVMDMPWKGAPRYENVGFRWPIQQSNYDYYIKKFEKKHLVKVKVYRFEDLMKEKEFPHINESEFKRKFTKKETKYMQSRLEEAGISY